MEETHEWKTWNHILEDIWLMDKEQVEKLTISTAGTFGQLTPDFIQAMLIYNINT